MTTSTRLHPAIPEKKSAGFFPRIFARAGRMHPGACGLFALGLALAAAGNAAAALVENAVAGSRYDTLNQLGDDELIIEEVFSSHLPKTMRKYGLRLSVNPHLGDWQKKDHMRLTTTLRYGLTEKCEVSVGSNLFFSHGNRDVRAFDNYGAANLKVGMKLNLGQLLFRGWDTAIGLSYVSPLDHPPAELTDGLRHLQPYVSFSHRLEKHPDLRIFVGLRGDNVAQTGLPGEIAGNAFHESSTGITGGMVIDRNNWHYTFEASFDSTRMIGGTEEDIMSFRPGVLWEVPKLRDRLVRSNWMVGVALNHTYGPGGNSLGVSFKVRYSRDLKNPIHRTALAWTR